MKGGARTPVSSNQNRGSRSTCARVQSATCGLRITGSEECGWRSTRTSDQMAGSPTASRNTAAATQLIRQPIMPATATKSSGKMASPALWPRLTSDTARPLLAAYQRPVAVSAFCVIIPWPNRRSM